MNEIERIKGIEKDISVRIGKEQALAKKKIEDYRERMPGLVEKEKERAMAEVEKEVGRSKSEGEKEAESILSAADTEVKRISSQGKKNLGRAVDVVVSGLSGS